MGMSAHFQFIQTYSEKRFAKTEDLKAANFGIGRLSPEEYALLQKCPASDARIERSFSKLRKLLAKDRNFAEKNHNLKCQNSWRLNRHFKVKIWLALVIYYSYSCP